MFPQKNSGSNIPKGVQGGKGFFLCGLCEQALSAGEGRKELLFFFSQAALIKRQACHIIGNV